MKPSAEILFSLSEVLPQEWDNLVDPNNPFCTHAFLHTMEQSRSVGGQSGWTPCHIVLRDEESQDLMAAMPLYLKTHSYGEYIFDWSWADASERAGIPYFPKLVSAVPFTPASGDRLLIHPTLDRSTIEPLLIDLAQQVAEIDKMSPETWCVVGNCFSLQKEHDTALKFFSRSIQMDPTFTYAHTLSGHEYIFYICNEDLDKAQASFRDAIFHDERHYNAWYGLGKSKSVLCVLYMASYFEFRIH